MLGGVKLACVGTRTDLVYLYTRAYTHTQWTPLRFQIKFEQYRNAIVKLIAVAIPPIVDERTPTFVIREKSCRLLERSIPRQRRLPLDPFRPLNQSIRFWDKLPRNLRPIS